MSNDNWTRYLDRLPQHVREQLKKPGTAERGEYAKFIDSLSAPAKAQVGATTAVELPTAEVLESFFYYVAVIESGGWPVLRGFRQVDDLVSFIASIEGTDVIAIPFHGVPMQFTLAKPDRYLFLSDKTTAMQITQNRSKNVVSADSIAIPIQTDFFVGPEPLSSRYSEIDSEENAAEELDPVAPGKRLSSDGLFDEEQDEEEGNDDQQPA